MLLSTVFCWALSPLVQSQTLYTISMDYMTFSALEDRLEAITTEDIKNKYEIEDSVWISLSGSHSFSSNFHGFLDISTKQEDASNNLKMLAALSNEDYTFKTRRGKIEGQFSQYVNDGSGTHQIEEVSTEYFSIDAQYGSEIFVGIRYLDMSAPTVLEYPPTIDLSQVKTITKDGLDPNFKISAWEFILGMDQFQHSLRQATTNPDWYPTVQFMLGIGFGEGTISETGRINYEAASSQTLTDNKVDVEVIEAEAKISYAKDFRIASNMKATIAVGYAINVLSYYAEDGGGSFDDLVVEQEIYNHGPSFTLGMVY